MHIITFQFNCDINCRKKRQSQKWLKDLLQLKENAVAQMFYGSEKYLIR